MAANFFDLYLEWTRGTFAPERFHRWAAVSLMSAALRRNVWVEAWKGLPTFPMTYVMLVGSSGCGKSVAMTFAQRLASADERIRAVEGGFTKQGLLDFLRRDKENPPAADIEEDLVPTSHTWLIMNELANDIGEDNVARMFVKQLTDAWEKSNLRDVTRNHGERVVDDMSLTWTACTTISWARDCLRKQDLIDGGFSSRVYVILGKTDYNRRPTQYIGTDAINTNEQALRERLRALCDVQGEVAMTPEAWELLRHIDESRLPPTSDEWDGHWRRYPHHITKLALMHSFARPGRPDYEIKPVDIEWARGMVDSVYGDLPVLKQLVTVKKGAVELVDRVVEAMKEFGPMGTPILWSKLAHTLHNRGIVTTTAKHCLASLAERGSVVKVPGPSKGDYYALLDGDTMRLGY